MEKTLSLTITDNSTFTLADIDTLLGLLERVGYDVEHQTASTQIHITISES